jgi:hypothetical protein
MSKNCGAFSEASTKASIPKTQLAPVSLLYPMTAKVSPAAAVPAQTAGDRLDFLNDI